MSRIIIGEADGGHPVHLDIDVFLRTRMLVQAASGQGKSHWLRRLCELLFGKLQVFVLDVEGEFSTLRPTFDFAVIGEGGDAPADVRSAGLLAHKLLELGTSAIFDLSEAFRKHPRDRHTWVKTFLGSMMEAPKRLWHPVVVVVDEAHKFSPEKDESEASEAMIALTTDGRKRQFCAVFATQRLGKLSKDAAAELLNVMIGGTSLDIDRKRAADALGVYGKELQPFNDQIKTIERGFFWCLGPAIAKERVLVHVGETETKTPKFGTRAASEPPPPTEKIKALLPQLADLPKLAAEKAQTEAELRKRIRELEHEIRSRPMQKVQPAAAIRPRRVSEAELVPALMPVVARLNAQIGQYLEQHKQRLRKLIDAPATPIELNLRQVAHETAAVLNKDAGAETAKEPGRPGAGAHQAPAANPLPAYKPSAAVEPGSNGTKMVAGARRVLEVLKQFHPETKTKSEIIVLAGVTGRSLKDYLSVLRRNAYIFERGANIGITDEGAAAAGDVQMAPQTTEDLVSYWKPKIGAGASRVLDVLVAAYPGEFDRLDLVERAQVTPRSMKDYLSILRRGRLIDESSGQIKASESLFP